jgi:hypothetical protein
MVTGILQDLELPAGNWPIYTIGGSLCLLLFVLLERLPGRHTSAHTG